MLLFTFTLVVMSLSAITADFSLADQFEMQQNIEFKGKQTIVMIGDRAGLKEMPRWEESLRKQLSSEPLHIVRVAYFKGMPFFVPKSWARDEVKSTYAKTPVLCDWDGIMGDKYGYKDGFTALFVDASGQVRTRVTGEFAEGRVKSFVQGIR